MTVLALCLAVLQPVDEAKVDAAIRKGIEYLRTAKAPAVSFAKLDDTEEIVLLTFVHARVPESDPKFQEMFKRMVEKPVERTYEAVLQAMILEEMDRVKHQARIAQCAQFLVDNQCANGQWSYGEPSEFVKEVAPPKDVSTGGAKAGVKDFGGGAAAPGQKPKVVRKVAVKKMKDGPAQGDNSNSQYAALGLRACHDAGVVLPKELLQLARKWWIESQHPEDGKDKGAVASGGGGGIRGWCYARKDVCAKTHRPYSSMTAGAVGAMAIYDHLLEIDAKKDPVLRAGLNWLAVNFSVSENVGPVEFEESPKTEIYYTLYALERLGMLLGVEKIGTHEWYPQGAKAILDAQKATGAWDDGVDRSNATWDTCFAILFLKKATRALVASEDPRGKSR